MTAKDVFCLVCFIPVVVYFFVYEINWYAVKSFFKELIKNGRK